MAHKAHVRRKTLDARRRTLNAGRQTLVREVCPECGYAAVHLHEGRKCPMCKPCARCGRKVMHCECIEGE